MTINLIKPHWGELISLKKTKDVNFDFKITLNNEQIIELHNISKWIYSPLKGFLKEKDFLSVINFMKLANGTLWPLPIVLDISKTIGREIKDKKIKDILLINKLNKSLAILKNIEIYKYSKKDYSKSIFWTTDKKHPWVKMIYDLKDYLIGWDIVMLNNINLKNNKFFSPKKTRKIFKQKWWKKIVAFQTRNPPHISHEYLQKCALEWCDGLFINPVIGKKKKWDFKDKYIIWAYDILIKNYYKKDHVFLWVLPLTMKYAWPKEAILHAIIRQNFWCTHMIIWRDHAWIWDFYWTYEAQNIFDNFTKKDINIKILKYENAGFCSICKTVTTNKTCPHLESEKMHISWTNVRNKILNKEILPWDFMRKEISEYLIKWNKQFIN